MIEMSSPDIKKRDSMDQVYTRSNKRFKINTITATTSTELVNEKESNSKHTPNFNIKKQKKQKKKKDSSSVKMPRLSTVRELFQTGLLEGYPVFYNGGNRGFRLRGTIKDGGILCSCNLCRQAEVIPPCKFEIHACKAYRRASQYICFENGISLLDAVKECGKASSNTLQEAILKYVGPLPVSKSVVCTNCQGLFRVTSSAKEEQLLCDPCLIGMTDAQCDKFRPLEPLSDLTMRGSAEVLDKLQKNGRRGRKKKLNSQLVSSAKSSERTSFRLSKMSSLSSLTNMPSEPTATTRASRSTLVWDTKSSSDTRISNSSPSLNESLKIESAKKISKTKMPHRPTSVESGSPSVSQEPESNSSWKITTEDHKMHELVFENGGLPDGTEVAYFSNGKKLRGGYKMGSGIICRCCNTLVSPSLFEAHAGWASRRKPYMHIYTSNGESLHEYAISLLKGRNLSSKENDDLCIICADGGELVLCDGCPRAFHRECASLSSIPHGKWFCTYCQNMFQRESFAQRNGNSVAAGSVSGIDPVEPITNRCIRVVKNPEEAEVISCVICRGYDFSKSGFGPRTVIVCNQCEKEYHVGCLKKCKMADLKELPKRKWFCSVSCGRIYSALQNLINAGEEKLPNSSLDIMRQKKRMDNSQVDDTELNVACRLLNGTIRSRETRVLLSQAVAIFHDSFDPIVDSETGRDFIPSMVYGRNIRGQNFSGMYCAILTVNSTVESAGILRIFGQDMAELPLAATRAGNQGKGYFQTLFSCIEKLLAFLNVKKLVLPATDEASAIWTHKFGFENIPQEQLLDYRKICWQMITFKGTTMLEKSVPECRIISNDEEAESDIPLQ